MTIPRNQSTGSISESVVELAFKRWGWNVGWDDVDEGYDLTVIPDRDRYGGHRFLVQVKGTAKFARNKAIVAEVEASRLRQYATDPIPVYIVRVTPDDKVYWVHAQAWAGANPRLLAKSGKVRLRFNPEHRLNDRAIFERSLFEAIFSWARDPEAAVSDKARFLNSLDPRFGVRLTVSDRGTEHELFAKQENVASQLSFTPHAEGENLQRLRDVIEFGVPADIAVSGLQLKGSPLFDYIHTGPLDGTLRIESSHPQECMLRVVAGTELAEKNSLLVFDAKLSRGIRGIEVSNRGSDQPLELRLRFYVDAGQPRVDLSFSVREDVLSARCLQDVSGLEGWAEWAAQAIQCEEMTLQVRHLDATLTVPIRQSEYEQIEGVVHWMRVIGRLHRAACSLDSAFRLPQKAEVSEEDFKDISMLDQLARGERSSIVMHAFEFEPAQPIEPSADSKFYITTTIEFRFFDRVFIEIPVVVDLSGYVFESVPGTTMARVSPQMGSTAHISRWTSASPLPKPTTGTMSKQ